MILEAAMIHLRPGQEALFEGAFREASAIIPSMPGYRSHQPHRCVEVPVNDLLLVRPDRLQDYAEGFLGSPPLPGVGEAAARLRQPLPDRRAFPRGRPRPDRLGPAGGAAR